MPLIIKWNKRALNGLIAALEYIRKDSFQNAEKVQEEILAQISFIADHPEIFPPDNYKLENDGSFRAFELHHYRISYRVFGNDLRIERVRHTKRNPRSY